MPGARGNLLIVTSCSESAQQLAAVIEEEGFSTVTCSRGEVALEAFAASCPAAVLLDSALPDVPAADVCGRLRAADALVPIVLVGECGDEEAISLGLGAGADDFVPLPFRRVELVARLEAHLRKANAVAAVAEPARVHRFGEVDVDAAARVVRVGGAQVALGPLEFKLLDYFCSNAGIAVSREQILSEVYGYDAHISTERVDLLVRRLRSKLGQGAARGGQLVAVPGYGYRLERRLARGF